MCSFQQGLKINKSTEAIVTIIWSVSLLWRQRDKTYRDTNKTLYHTETIECLPNSPSSAEKFSKGKSTSIEPALTPLVQTVCGFALRPGIFYSFEVKRNLKYPLEEMTFGDKCLFKWPKEIVIRLLSRISIFSLQNKSWKKELNKWELDGQLK